jgi:hypothetical protein
LAIGGVSSPLDIPITIGIVVAESSVLRTNFCAEKPAHRKSAKRKTQFMTKAETLIIGEINQKMVLFIEDQRYESIK